MKFCTSSVLAALAAVVLAACGTSSGGTNGGGGGTVGADVSISGDVSTKSDSVGDASSGGDGSSVGKDAATGDGGADQALKECCKSKGAECGYPPTCNGFCGGCATGKACDTKPGSPTQFKCVVKAAGPVKKKAGEHCGADKTCVAPGNGATQAQQQAYQQCLDDQCDTGLCFMSVCSKACTIAADSKNNATGQAQSGGDGIEDPDAATDCEGFVDGPQGTSFKCVQLTNPASGGNVSYCVPGTTFKPCKSNPDCTGGEVCSFRYIRGSYVTVCAPSVKEVDGKAGQDNGGYCNDNPASGAVASCKNNLCLGFGMCVDFCKSDADCAGGGQPMICKKDTKIFGATSTPVSVCFPKNCYLDEDCKDPNYYCLTSYNGVKNQDGDPDPNDPTKIKLPSWDESVCVKKAPNTAKKGTPCNQFPSDTTSKLLACETKYWCINGVCGNHCKSDANCTADQKCEVEEIPLDTSDPADKKYDVFTALKVCAPYPSAKGDCFASNQCKDATSNYCRVIEVDMPAPATGTAAGKYDLKGLCIAPSKDLAALGESCGAAVGKGCQSGLCLGQSTDATGAPTPGWCTDICSQKSDCPDQAPIEIAQGTKYKFACGSIGYGNNGSSTPLDNLYMGLCLPQAPNSSMVNCSADFKCAAGETCNPKVITFGPTYTPVVEYYCNKPWGQTAPTKKVGEACNPNPGDTDPPECISGMCMPDSTSGKGYCSALCKSNADCGSNDGMFCDAEHQWLPRADKSKAAIVPVCAKKKSCVPCSYDFQCATGLKCTWPSDTAISGVCAPPCNADADCAATDGGSKCEAAKGIKGDVLSQKVCTPACK